MAPIEKPDELINWPFRISIYFETDGVFPTSLLYQFIVDMSYDVNESYTWNKGTLLTSELFDVNVLVQIKDNKFYVHLDKKNENACNYLSSICRVFQRVHHGLNIECNEYVGICHNGRWRYLSLNRMINMLSKGKKTDFLDGVGWDCDVDIREVLSYITPYLVMKQIDNELEKINEDRRTDVDFKTRFRRIEEKNYEILAYLEVIVKDTRKIDQDLEDIQRELPYQFSDLSKKIDKAIMEIKAGVFLNA
ncbi:hypothetical protein [Hungatella hathewayi]|uniref:hypothetical protein n=1 Tax=Hungatella hathewayi TaxID=154046 RepID=UPI0035627FDD